MHDEQNGDQQEFKGEGWGKEGTSDGKVADEKMATAVLDFTKTIRIAVTGDVHLTATEEKVIDTADFQRLRGIRQLGTVNFVFPTALHTRFDHSLGTLAKADEMVLAIATNPKSRDMEREITQVQRQLARMYALLHDLPHVPFGHTIEDEMGLFTRHDKNPARIERFLGPDSEVGQILMNNESEEFYDRFMAIYLWEDDPEKKKKRASEEEKKKWEPLSKWLDMSAHDDAFMHDIVSNTVCADLLDYVARDNYFCNLGMSREYRFINYLYLKEPCHLKESDSDNKRRMFVRLWKADENKPRRDLLTDLTHLMDARYMVAERAYFHHTKLVTGAMLGRALQEYKMSEKEGEEYLYDKSDETLLKELRDWEKRNRRTEDDKKEPLALATLLSLRKLHRTVAVYGEAAFERAQEKSHEFSFKDQALKELRNPESRRDFEDWFAAIVGKRPGSVLVYAPDKEMNVKVAQVNVHWKGSDKTLSEIDDPVVKPRLETVARAHESLWSIQLVVSRDVGEAEVNLLKEEFTLQFLADENNEKDRKTKHYERILEHSVRNNPHLMEISHESYRSAIKKCAEPLLATARGKDSVEKLKRATKKLEEELKPES